jgi:hypothetical protein
MTQNNQQLRQSLRDISAWDWSNVSRLKAAIETLRDSHVDKYADSLPMLLERLQQKTSRRISIVHSRPIIAVDRFGQALTGDLNHLRIERIPYDPDTRATRH